MANCQKHLCNLEAESEAFTRALWSYYTVEQLKRIFNHGVSTLTFSSLTVILPSNNQLQAFASSAVFEQLYAGPVDLPECHLTWLVLLYALFELQQTKPDKEKALQLLQNMRKSLLSFQGHIP